MPSLAPEKLVIAISSRALFNLDAEHLVFENEGLEAYSTYQVAHEDTPLERGQAFTLAKKLLALNETLEDPLAWKLSSSQETQRTRVFASLTPSNTMVCLLRAPHSAVASHRGDTYKLLVAISSSPLNPGTFAKRLKTMLPQRPWCQSL